MALDSFVARWQVEVSECQIIARSTAKTRRSRTGHIVNVLELAKRHKSNIMKLKHYSLTHAVSSFHIFSPYEIYIDLTGVTSDGAEVHERITRD